MLKSLTDKAFSLAKITLPKIVGSFSRERLFHTMDEKRSRSVIWVSGPGGSGKTTLVASYLQMKNLPHIWYRVDEGDSDPATFFYYLGIAGKNVIPGNRKPMPLLRPEYLQGIPVFALRFFEDLYVRLKERTILVFDNYHRIPEQSPFHEAMCSALAAIPDGINVIIISRHAVPKALIRLQVNGVINRIGWKDLRLTMEETTGIVQARRQDIRSDAIRQLHRDADGWIAGLVLMLESLTTSDITRYSGMLSHDEIIDYFGNQVFDRLDSRLQQFLLKTAFLPRITVRMAEELTGLPDSVELLNRLAKNGYFTERDNSAEPVYRYHQLMRKFLITRARSEMTSGEIERLIAESARLLEASGAVENAAELRIGRGEWNDLIRIILVHAPELLAQGRYRVLESWLGALPPEILDASPWLIYWKAACLSPYKPMESVRFFEKTFRLFKEQNDDAGTLLAWSGAVDSILFAWENFTPLTSWLEWMDARLSNNPAFPSREIEARVAASMAGIFTWVIPSRPDVGEWVNRSMRLLPEIGDESMQLQALSNCFTYFFWNGDIGNMQPLVERAKAMALSPSATPLSRIVWKITEMRFKILLFGQHESCLRLADEALKLADKHGIYVQSTFIYAMASSAALCLNNLTLVEEFIRKMEALAPYTQRGMSNLGPYIEAWCHFLRDNPRYALTLAEKGLEISLECATPIPEILIRQLIAKILHELGERSAALLEVSKTKEVISRMGNSPMLLYFTLLDEAQFLFDNGEEGPALEALRSAMKIGAEHHYRTIMLHWRPALFADLCAKALEYDIETSYVRDLIRSLCLVPEKPPYETKNWPWSVRIYTLGGLKIFCDEIPVESSRKAPKKPLELLKVLLALGGKGVREEAITDTLWPESEGDAAHHSFEVNLKRLRDLLGYPEALQLRDGRLTLNDRLCRVDFWAFDRLINDMKDKMETQMALYIARNAVDIYSGHFLSGETDEGYSLSLREQLRAKFLATVRWLGTRLENSGQWQEAAECYERGLEVDDLAEELYRRLMNCHIHLGRKSEALLLFNRCKKILSTVLGIEPSDKTEKLYQSIKD